MKRRGQGEGTLYQRPDGKWMAQLDLGWRDGKRVRRSLYGATRRDVVEKLKAARKAIDAGLVPTSDRMTVAAYLEDWLEAKRGTVRPSTWTRYAGMVRKHQIPRLGRIPLSKLAAGDVERMLRDMPVRRGAVTMRAPSLEPPWRAPSPMDSSCEMPQLSPILHMSSIEKLRRGTPHRSVLFSRRSKATR